MADISKITLPSGTTYNLKDAQAREDIAGISAAIAGGVSFIGSTTTQLSDGVTTNPITINGNSVTATKGALVTYGDSEFLWDGTKWLFFGDFGSLGALAFKDAVSGQYKPAGTVSQPTFTGTNKTVSVKGTANGSIEISTGTGTANYTPSGTVTKPTFNGTEGNLSVTGTPKGSVTITTGTGTANYTPEGTVSKPTFNGTQGNVSVSGTPTGSVSITTGTGTANYTPEGTVSKPTFNGTQASLSVKGTPAGSVTITATTPSTGTNYTPEGEVSVSPSVSLNTTKVNSITNVGTLPTCTLPTWTGTVANENLTIGWTAGSFSQGTLPTKGADTTVATGIKNATATASFTGTAAKLAASFSGNELTSTGSYTPAGSVTQPTFSGTGAELKASFSGNSLTSTGKFTPAGSVTQPTFNGTGVELKATFSGNSLTSTGKFTPAGSVSQPTFNGTGVELTADFTGSEFTATGSFKPEGTVSQPTFTGTQSTITLSDDPM